MSERTLETITALVGLAVPVLLVLFGWLVWQGSLVAVLMSFTVALVAGLACWAGQDRRGV